MDQQQLPRGSNIVFYDGICGLCTKSVQFILRHDSQKVFYFAPLQGEFAKQILAAHQNPTFPLDTMYVLVNYGCLDQQLFSKSEAVLLICEKIGGIFQWLRILRFFPGAWLDHVYDWISNSRYAWFGTTDRCIVANPLLKERFVKN